MSSETHYSPEDVRDEVVENLEQRVRELEFVVGELEVSLRTHKHRAEKLERKNGRLVRQLKSNGIEPETLPDDEVTPEASLYLEDRVNEGNKIECIKTARDVGGLGLKEAKNKIEKVDDSPPSVTTRMPVVDDMSLEKAKRKFQSVGVSCSIQ